MDKYTTKRAREIWEDHPPVLELIDVLEKLGYDMPWTVDIPLSQGNSWTLGILPHRLLPFIQPPDRFEKRVLEWIERHWRSYGWCTPLRYLVYSGNNYDENASGTLRMLQDLFVENCGVVAKQLGEKLWEIRQAEFAKAARKGRIVPSPERDVPQQPFEELLREDAAMR